MSNSTYLHLSGIAEIGKNLSHKLTVTGLNDTPTGYLGHSGDYLVVNDGESGIHFTGIEKIAQDLTDYGFVGGRSDFTGLLDTPDNYSDGDYLRSTSNGLEYVTASGLAQDIGDEIVNNIVTGDLLAFTGLNDTPENYEARKFLRVNSAGDAVEYSDVSFLNDIVDAPENQLVSGYLQLDKDGKLVWSPATTDGDVSYTITGATHFTGLIDTPTGYEHGQYLRVHPSDKKLEYISVTGLAQDIGDEIVNNIVTGDLLAFTGLNDTPGSYIGHGSQYVIVNDQENAVHFTGIEKIAQDLTDNNFTSQPKTKEYNSEFDLPQPARDYDGNIVRVGCDLYVSCNGEWKELNQGTSSSEDLPGCVNNLEEYMQYEEYKQGVIGEATLNFFNAGLNDNLDPLVIDACLYTNSSLQNELNKVFIQESTFKWGIFTEPQTINISAVPHSESSDNFCNFSHWSSLNNSINGSTNANESFFLDIDTDITGHFDCFYPPGEASFEELLFGLQSNTTNNSTTIEDYSSNNYIIDTGGVINVDNTSHIDPIYGSSSLYFDKTRAMSFTPNESMSLGTSFTVEGWVYILSYASSNVSGTVFVIAQSHTGTNNTNVFSLAYNNNHKLRFTFTNSNGQLFQLADSSGPLSLNQWHHMAVVRDENMLTSYLNGVALNTLDIGTLPARTSSRKMHIGRVPNSADDTGSSYPQEHHGYMQDIRIVKRALYTSNFSVPSNFPTYK